MSTTTTKDWRDGLTAEQQATVEKAARAMFDARVTTPASRDEIGFARASLFMDALAALRAVGVIPPAKVKTRGEVVAEDILYLHEIGGASMFRLRYQMGRTGGAGLMEEPSKNQHCVVSQSERLHHARETLAHHIDAERAAARREAIADAVKVAERCSSCVAAREIRALATGAPR